MNERLLDLGLFILVLCIIIQIVYKSCIFNCTCGYWCTAVTRPSTAAYSRSPLLAVFQGHVATFPPPRCTGLYTVSWCTTLRRTHSGCTVLHCTLLNVLHFTLRFSVLHYTAFGCTAPLCTFLHSLYCTVVHYTVLGGGGDAACGPGLPLLLGLSFDRFI